MFIIMTYYQNILNNKKAHIEDLFNERTPLYEKYADIIINEHGHTIQQTVKLIEAKLGV